VEKIKKNTKKFAVEKLVRVVLRGKNRRAAIRRKMLNATEMR